MSGNSRRARAAGWLLTGPLPIPGICGIVAEYSKVLGGNCVLTLAGHTDYITSLAALPDGKLASGSYDNTVRVWDPTLGVHAHMIAGDDRSVYIVALVALPGRDAVASGSCEKTVCVQEASGDGDCLATLEGHRSKVTTLAVMPGGLLASGSWDTTVRVWDAASGECLLTLVGHAHFVNALAVIPDGRLASGSADGTVCVWDPNTGAGLSRFKCSHTSVNALAGLPDGKLASGSDDGAVRVWDVDTGACTSTLEGHTSSVMALAVFPDGTLASGSADHTVRVWNPATGTCLLTLAGHTGKVSALTVLPDGRLASGSWDRTVRVWE